MTSPVAISPSILLERWLHGRTAVTLLDHAASLYVNELRVRLAVGSMPKSRWQAFV